MSKLEGFKVVGVGMTPGATVRLYRAGDMSKFFPKREEAEAEKESWQKDGTECGVIVWKE